MSKRGRQLREDRAMRDAALALVKADWAHLRGDLAKRGPVDRIKDKTVAAATDVFEEALETADEHKGIVGALLAGLVLWFARNPLLALFFGAPEEQDESDEPPAPHPEYYDPYLRVPERPMRPAR